MVSENYPTLRATGNFQTLQAEIEGSENRIAVERGRFNDLARDYNASIQRVPAVFFAAALGFKPKAYFAAAAGAETAPTVKFDFSNPAPAKP